MTQIVRELTLGSRNSPGSSTSAVLSEKLLKKRHLSSITNDLRENDSIHCNSSCD